MPEILQCCSNQKPVWVFGCKNGQIWAVCKVHYGMSSYRQDLDYVINIASRKRHSPAEIFGDGYPEEEEKCII